MATCSAQGLISLFTNPAFFGNSGKNNNDLGLFDECLENEGSSYFLVDTYFSPVAKITNGLCFEKNCSADELANAINVFINNTVAPSFVIAKKVSGNEGIDSIDGATIFIIILLSLLLLFGLASPTIQFFKYFIKGGLFQKNQDEMLSEELSKNTENEEKEVVKKKKKNIIFEILECFSLIENWKKLWAIRGGSLDFLNGVRALAFFYVVFGHDYSLRLTMVENQGVIIRIFEGKFFLFVAAAFYAVDVFFWIGGFFLSFVLLDKKQLHHLKKIATYPFAIIHRYMRIIPSYLIAIFVCWKIMNLTGSGPLWPNYVISSNECDYMWRNLLLVDNLFSLWDDKHYCFGWGWYLSNDFQIFFASLFAFFLYGIKPILGKLMIVIMMVGCLAAGLGIVIDKEYGIYPYDIFTFLFSDFFPKYYTKPWCRAPPYLFGILFGMYYREFINSKDDMGVHITTLLYKVKRFIIRFWFGKYLFYIYGLFIVFFFTFYPRTYQNDHSEWTSGGVYFWIAFQRLIYITGLNFLLMSNFLELKDYIGIILSWKPLGVISKLTFCGYLVHYMVIQRSVYNTRQSLYLNYENVHYFYFSDLFLTLFAAATLSLFVEIPFINIERLLKSGKSAKAGAIKEIKDKCDNKINE